MTYDVIVVGAGNGGLTSAATLAQAGRKVLLLEKHNVPGGCGTSFCRGRFEFEVALHQLSGLGTKEKPGPLWTFLDNLGVVDQLDWLHAHNLYRLILPGQLDITLRGNHKEELVALLQGEFPAEAGAIQAFYDLIFRFFEEIYRGFIVGDSELSKDNYPTYFTFALRSAMEVLDEFFVDPSLKLVLSAYWMWAGVAPEKLPFKDLAGMIYSYLEFTPAHLKGGSQAMSSAILNRFQESEGEARFRCGVKKIVVENGEVKGVLTEFGEVIHSSCVISNASTLLTYTELIDEDQVPPEQFDILGGCTVGCSSLTLYIGLDCPSSSIGITTDTTVMVTTTDTNHSYEQLSSMDTSDDMLLVTSYDLLDASFAPEGCSQIAVVDLKYGQPWINLSPTEYYASKYQAAETILCRLEEQFPGLREHIEEMEVATPLTHMRYLGHPGGAIYGFDQTLKNSSVFVSPRSPIKGLFFAGSWVDIGGFETSLESGGKAAIAVLKEMK